MRVYQLNTYCGVKSTGRIVCEIAKLVQADGGECRIGYGIPGISQDSEPFAYRIGTPLQRKVHAVARKLLDAEGYGSLIATKELIQDMQQFKPDVIHFHNLHGCYLHLNTLFTAVAGMEVPVVWTLHDCWPFTGHCAYFDYSGCQKWTSGCHHCNQQRSYPICIGLDGSSRNYKDKKAWFTQLKNLTFVAPCEWMKQPLSRSFMKHYPARVIYNGVNLQVFRPTDSDVRSRYGIENSKLCLAVAAEWDERKGLRYIKQASQMLGDAYRFVVIGLDAEQIAELPENIIGIERTADVSELAAWYTAADCLVNPTLEDNMPMVNLEALACGTPVAVFKTGGCPEAITPECGRVVQQGNVDELCKAVQQLCNLKPSIKAACLQQAQRFDANQTFRSYLQLYKELCK